MTTVLALVLVAVVSYALGAAGRNRAERTQGFVAGYQYGRQEVFNENPGLAHVEAQRAAARQGQQ